MLSIIIIKLADWTDFNEEIAMMLLNWIYTDNLDLLDYKIAIQMIKMASQFKLNPLMQR